MNPATLVGSCGLCPNVNARLNQRNGDDNGVHDIPTCLDTREVDVLSGR